MNDILRLKQIFSKCNLLIIICACFLFSCKSNKEKNKNELIKKETKKELYNTGTLTCKINGESNEIHSNGIMTDKNTGMQTCIADNDNYQVQIIFPTTLAEGQTSNNCKGLVMTNKPVEVYKNTLRNSVSVTKRTNKIVAGTFAFEVNSYEGSTKIIKVTEGKFEAEILN